MNQTEEKTHMFQAELDLRALHRWMGRRNLRDHALALHCLLTEGLGTMAPRVHRGRTPPHRSRGVITGYTGAEASTLRETLQAYGDPWQSGIILPESLESKQMPDNWQEGTPLGFEVKIRPTVRLERDISRVRNEILPGFRDGRLRPGRTCDLHLWETVRSESRGEPPPRREELYPRWLAGKLERQGGCRADPEEMELATYRSATLACKAGRPGDPGPEAVVKGVLRITDPQAFRELIHRGVGRHRAYGYGMVLLKPLMAGR